MPSRLIGGYHPADEMYRIHILAAAALMTVFSASCDSRGPEDPDPLEEIGEYVFDRPDSALNALSEISPSQLETREEKARCVLLSSIASELSADGMLSDSLRDATYGYYEKFGTSRRRLSSRDRREANFLVGKICAFYGNENAAMSCFVRAEHDLDGTESPEFAGRLRFAKAILYEDGFGYRDATDDYDKASKSFLEAGNAERYAESCIRAANCCLSLGDRDRARSFLSRMDSRWDEMRDSDKVRYLRLLARADDDVTPDDVLKAVDAMIEYPGTLDAGNLLAISDLYLQSGYVDSAMVYLNRYSVMNAGFRSSPTFWLRLSNAYDSLGLDDRALAAYRKHVVLKDSIYMDRLQENVRFVEKRFLDQVRTYNTRIVWMWVFIALALMTVTAVFFIFRFRRKFWRQSRRAEHLEELYRSASAEKDALSSIMKGAVLIDEPTRKVLENRLSVLDELLTVRLLDRERYSPEKASEMIESIALDRDAYLNSLGLMFSLRHPAVADRFRTLQLSTWEIGYCSLYCMGYKGKDVGNILSSSRYYKINSVIRKKLGIGPKDTNIDIYLRKMMSDIESGKDAAVAGEN